MHVDFLSGQIVERNENLKPEHITSALYQRLYDRINVCVTTEEAG